MSRSDSSDPPAWEDQTGQHELRQRVSSDPIGATLSLDHRVRRVEKCLATSVATDAANARWIKAGAGLAGVVLTGVAYLVMSTLTTAGDVESLASRLDRHIEAAPTVDRVGRLDERVTAAREREQDRYDSILTRLDTIDGSLSKLLDERRGPRRRTED